jgi:hypothetical protein
MFGRSSFDVKEMDMQRNRSNVSTLGAAALIIMAGGFGWIGGDFPPQGPGIFILTITLVHFAPLLALILLAPPLFTTRPAHGARYGVTAVACFGLLSILVAIGLTLANPAPDTSGLHSFYDYVATVIVFIGSALWLLEMLRRRNKAHSVEADLPLPVPHT